MKFFLIIGFRLHGKDLFERNINVDLFCKDRSKWQTYHAIWTKYDRDGWPISDKIDADLAIAASNLLFIKRYLDYFEANGIL